MIEYQNKFDDKVEVSKLIVDYSQSGDCAEDVDNWQTLRLESVSNGIAPFIRISLPEGGHFSVSDIHDLEEIFKDFEEKLNYNENSSNQ